MKNKLEEKLEELRGLSGLIKFLERPLLRLEKQEEENIRFRMEFQLSELVKRSKLEEAEIKIKFFNEIIKLLKNEQDEHRQKN